MTIAGRKWVTTGASLPHADPPSVILFGTGSPVVVDVEESCARLGWRILAAMRNFDAPDWTSADIPIRLPASGTVLDGPVLVPLFTPANRRQALAQAMAMGATDFPSLVDATSILPRRIAIGAGSYINAGCVLGAMTEIGRFVFINRGASLGHHLQLGDFASVGPGVVIAGQVSIGAGAMIGAGAVILPGVRVGAGAMVPAGAVVRRDVPPA